MKIQRKFTVAGQSPFETVKWTRRSSRITNPDGSVVFEMADAEVPAQWSQLATDIMVSKYFRKAGVPQYNEDGTMRRGADGEPELGPERSARQVIHRLAGCWKMWGRKHGYFESDADADAFYDELAYMLVHQMAAPNSPQWFNTGLNFAYGTSGPAQGHWFVDPKSGSVQQAEDAYTHPQPHACFIQSIDDNLVNDGGIMDLWVREARLFKYGSGTGTNFSSLRSDGELLSGGGRSSGLMSWLKIGDRAAGAIKSGGTTRRAAKMVCLDMDHPDIEKFVNWKVREEIKVAAMVEGLKVLKKKDEQTRQTAERLGLELDYDFNGEAYATVSGQNSNNSVRIPDSFFDAVDADGQWTTRWRTTGEDANTFPANGLWDQIGYAAWRCADPGVQFDSTINAWHTCPSDGRINASNPCSEYMFLDNTACNLASLNVLKFFDAQTRTFDVDAYEHAIDLWTVVLEISVLMAAFPSKVIAELSYRFRTLGLGYANLGAMLMQAGVPYDSDDARAVSGMLTAILTGRSARQSALLASEHGPFAGFESNRESMLRVMRNHRRAAHGIDRESNEYEQLRIRPVPIDHALVRNGRLPIANAQSLLLRATQAWDDAIALGNKHGFRNAQLTVIAPTGTIGLLMDCDTTGIEPDFALVKFKKLAGGGYFKIANASLKPALHTLGYTSEQVREILTHILGTLSLDVPMPADDGSVKNKPITLRSFLIERGLNDSDLRRISDALPGVFDLSFAFSAYSLGDETLGRAQVDAERARADSGFNLLSVLGLNARQLQTLNRMICGTQTIESAPHVKPEHLPVFDCANTCGQEGKRFIAPEGHIRMMAAAQPFISGAISKTINLQNDASVEDIKSAYRLSWELGLKANALYRDGCKKSQPLSSKVDEAEKEEDSVESRLEKSDETSGAAVPAAADALTRELLEAVPQPEVRIVERPMRRRLPDTRASITHKFNIGGHEGYLTVGLYEDSMPGELFITMAKEGSTIGGLMDCIGTAVSVALQYGVPVESLVNKFTHQRFEPAGMTTNADIPIAKSLVDYIFRWMGMEFVPGYREANAPRRSRPKTDDAAGKPAAPRMTPAARRLSDVVERGERDKASDLVVRTEHMSVTRTSQGAVTSTSVDALSVAMRSNQSDAPACETCGAITVRSGTCYKCLNCGASMGCS